jgi:hypothetical protein
MVTSPQVSWLFFKAVRAGLAVKRPYLRHTGRSAAAEEKQPTGPGPEGCVENGPARETYRRVGVSKRQKQSSQTPRRPDAQTPIRQHADTLPQPAAHFERNDVTIICEAVH